MKYLGCIALVAVTGCSSALFDRPRDYLAAETIPADVTFVDKSQAVTLGLRSFASGNYPLATAYLGEASRLDPENRDLRLQYAAAADRAGQFEISREIYLHELAKDRTSFEILNNLGFSLLLQGRPEEALVYLELALEVQPGNETAMNNLSLVRRVLG